MRTELVCSIGYRYFLWCCFKDSLDGQVFFVCAATSTRQPKPLFHVTFPWPHRGERSPVGICNRALGGWAPCGRCKVFFLYLLYHEQLAAVKMRS